MRELELTPELEAEIAIRAATLRLDPELLRYYTQFGPGAPKPPPPPSRWRRLWWRVSRR